MVVPPADRRGAVADEAGEVVGAPALAGVHDERDLANTIALCLRPTFKRRSC